MVKIPVEVKCLGEMCKGCKQMDIDMEGVHFLPDGIRGLPMFDPHCKHMSICRNALELNKPIEEQKNGINLNDWVKVKLTERGKDIYRRDRTQVAKIVKTGNVQIEPDIDDEGFTKFQLWHFIEIFGKYIGMCEDAVIMPVVIYPFKE